MEQSFIMIKPDAVERGLVGEIIKRFENKGFNILEQRKLTLTKETASKLYSIHEDKPFFNDLIDYVTTGPVVIMKVEAESAVGAARSIIGATNPLEAAPGTIRGDFGLDISRNLIHGSDSIDNASYELGLFF